MGSACLFFVFFLGCGYSTSTGTQLRVLAPYICMGSSHACAIVQVAVSRERCSKWASKAMQS